MTDAPLRVLRLSPSAKLPVRADDGRIVELASTTSGLPMSTATVFASEGDFLAFKKPSSFVGHFELW